MNHFNNQQDLGLVFVATTCLAASGVLEIPALGVDVGFGVVMRGSQGLSSPYGDQRAGQCRSPWRGAGLWVGGETLALGLEDVTPGRKPSVWVPPEPMLHLFWSHNHSNFVFPARKLHPPDYP